MTNSPPSVGVPSPAALHRLFRRVHFWAGLITAPIVLFAACTGLLYVFTPQIEARVHADMDHVPVSGEAQPLDAQFAAARTAFATLTPRSIVPGLVPGETTQVLFAAPPSAHAVHSDVARQDHDHGLPQGHIVYVNPYTAQVVGSLAEMERFKTWAKKLHSSVLQGDGWRWLIELGASWLLVMLATGITLWWPRSKAAGGPGWRALIPRLGRGRATWRDLHTSFGVLMSSVLVVVLVTGLTWSRHAGENFRVAQAALGQSSPKAPKDLHSQRTEGSVPLSMQTIYDTARVEFPDTPLQLTPPQRRDGVWRVDSVARNRPGERLTLLIDAGSGQILYRSGWAELPALAKATAVGIPFHRAEFGLWNQVLMGFVALTVIFSVASGFVMWWQRRPARHLAAPPISARQVRAAPLWLWPLAAALALAMPVFGISLAVLISFELAAAAWQRWRAPSTPSIA